MNKQPVSNTRTCSDDDDNLQHGTRTGMPVLKKMYHETEQAGRSSKNGITSDI